MSVDPYAPRPEHHFTFGLWTVGNVGRDPFGDPVRAADAADAIVRELAKLGAYGVNLHDNDLVPRDATAAERDRIVREFKAALDETGMKVPMATTNLFGDPVFRDGAFTSNDARVRAYALQKTMRAIDLGVELGAETYVFWGGREGVETNAGEGSAGSHEVVSRRDQLPLRVRAMRRGTSCKFALEPKPNEPRGDIFLPTIGHMLAFIYTLDHPEMVGLNPEVAHDTMAGLDFSHGVAQALEAGKLFHIDLNAQKPGRFDQDLRFGSEDVKGAFFLVKLLEDAKWPGMRHFDSHAYRTEDDAGRVGLRRAAACAPISSSRRRWRASTPTPRFRACSSELSDARREPRRAREVLARRRARAQGARRSISAPCATQGYAYERLDQLTMELLLGVR